MEGYCVTLPKSTKKPIPSLKYFVIQHQRSTLLLEGYYSCPNLLNTLAIPFVGYPRNTLGSITYLLKLVGALHNHTKITQYIYNTFHRLSQKYIGLHNLKCGRVLHSPTKTYKQNNSLLGVCNNTMG
jgi:hypothetical protein